MKPNGCGTSPPQEKSPHTCTMNDMIYLGVHARFYKIYRCRECGHEEEEQITD
jgi:hypothetical protein